MRFWDYDQPDWGSVTEYPDDPGFQPRYLVVHWGGNTDDIIGTDAEQLRLRSWQRYHMESKGWRDIAYNFAVGDTGAVYRLRGFNPGGHTSSTNDRTPEGDSYNNASLGVVWIGGANAEGPSQDALDAMDRIVWATGLGGDALKGHRTVKYENGSSTACPGDKWLEWIDQWGEDPLDGPPHWDDVAGWARPSWLKAYEAWMLSEDSQPQGVVTVERLMVFLDRAGVLDTSSG